MSIGAIVAVVGASLAGALPARSAETPSLRLLTSKGEVTLQRYDRRVYLDLGVLMTPVGGDFEIRVGRSSFGEPIQAAQVDAATGDVIRTLPAELLDGFSGLRRALVVTFRDADGEKVARRRFTLCPNSYERQRLSDQGSDVVRYPYFCATGFPFLRGMVWGIEDHWAVPALGGGDYEGGSATMRVPAGTYTTTVAITRTYADLFAIAEADRLVTLKVTIEKGGHRGKEVYYHRDGSDIYGAGPTEGVPTTTSPDPSALPDLAALPAWSLATSSRNERDYVDFAANVWNAGPGPLVVEGFRRSGTDTMDAYQYFYDPDGNVVGRAPSGTFEYDDRRRHHHWHFEQFAQYSLVDRESAEVVRSGKQAFCIVPTDAVDLTLKGATWTGYSEDGLHTQCGGSSSVWVREHLEPGWGDTYYQGIPGQSLEVTGLPNGWYYIRVHANPTGLLLDADPGNDVEQRMFFLGGEPGARTAVAAPWHGIEA
ncbi:MAG: lysyl oxidase family protein [Actinomycetota bacterium]